MCGQCGIILGKKRRTRKELEALGNMFTSLLQCNERRGRDATGIYVADKDKKVLFSFCTRNVILIA